MELINYFKKQTKEDDYLVYEKIVRYDHIGERIQYFEEKIFEDELTKLRGKGFSHEVAEKRARKKVWIDWLPFLLQNVEVTGKEKEEFKKADTIEEKNKALTSYKTRLRKKLTPKFERIAVMRDLSNAECINFSTTSFAQILDFIITLTGVIATDDSTGEDIVDLAFDKFKKGDYEFDLADLKINKVAEKMRRLANKSADYASSEAVGLAKKVKNDTTTTNI